MNYCTRCHSFYAYPGTCNCFAPKPVAPASPGTGTPLGPTITPWRPSFTGDPMPPSHVIWCAVDVTGP